MLSDAVGAMIAGGHTQEAVNILSDLFGPRMASNLVDFFTEAQHLRELGFTQEQIDNLYNFRKQTNAVGLQLEVLVAQIGTDLLPIAEAMISAFQRFWKEHGPAITTAIRNIAQWLSANLVPAIQSVWQWLSSNLGPAIQSVAQWITGRFVPAVTTAWTWLTGSFIPSVDKAATSVGTAFTQSVTAVSTAFNRDFGPAIQFVKGLIDEQMRVSDSLRTSLGILATQVSGSLSSAFDGAGRAVSGFLSGIRDIYNFVTSTFNGAIANLQSQLAALHPPAIFTPGSPTPFEMGLRGIHDAMRNINREGLPEIGTQSAIDRAMSAGTPLQYAQVLPATPAQMGASSVTNNDSRVAYVTINVDGGDGASVQDGVYGALVRAGFVMVS
jgi:hypothetical protein